MSKPTSEGTYRIKVFSADRYLEYVPGSNPVVKLAKGNANSPNQRWLVKPSGKKTCKITSVVDSAGLIKADDNDTNYYWGYGYVLPKSRQTSFDWIIQEVEYGGEKYCKIKYADDDYSNVDSCKPDTDQVHFFMDALENKNQQFIFELVNSSGGKNPGGNKNPGDNKNPGGDKQQGGQTIGGGQTSDSGKNIGGGSPIGGAQSSFEAAFFTFTIDQAKVLQYDIIVVGTGIGGGILAGDLFDTNSQLGKNAKSILVIERGGLVFHSHCLNTSRPSGLGEDRGQQNDTFFAKFKKSYNLSSDTSVKDVKAGPMYNLGGRSAAWGLFVPRIHDQTLDKDFPTKVKAALIGKYYREAENLMHLSLPTTKTIHQDLIERLNVLDEPEVQWQWGRIASEFNDQKNFDFAEGAYSTIDKLLEIAMSKPKENGKEAEHQNFRILLRTEVRKLTWEGNRVSGVVVRGPDGKETEIRVKQRGRVVLCAGSVDSAAILLRSGKEDFLKKNGGLRLTDHDIFATSAVFQFNNRADRQAVGSMKLQTYARLKKQGGGSAREIVLVNMSIDASSFLPRTHSTFNDYPKWIIAFIRTAELNNANYVKLGNGDEPVVKFNRNKPFSLTGTEMDQLKSLTRQAKKTLADVLGLTFIPQSEPSDAEFFKPLEMGGVAHELGTIPIKRTDNATTYCLEDDLKLRDHEGVYVCDLSIFASSPEANPTLTLAALSLRLSRETLMPLVLPDSSSLINSHIYVVNHSGQTVKVFVGNRSQVDTSRENQDLVLGPGEYGSWKRKPGVIEAVYVFRLSFNSTTEFSTVPEFLTSAGAGRITVVP